MGSWFDNLVIQSDKYAVVIVVLFIILAGSLLIYNQGLKNLKNKK